MDDSERISGKQATRLFLLATASPIIRIVPIFTAVHAGKAAWISGIIGVCLCVLVAYFFYKMFNNDKMFIKNLDEALEKSFGKGLTIIIMCIILVIQFFVLAIRLRTFTERIETILFIDTIPSILMLGVLPAVLVACKLKLKFLGRFTELLEIMLTIVFVIVIVIAMQNFDITNIIPVTTYDIPGAFLGSIAFLSVMASYGYVFFFGDSITQRHQLLKAGTSAALLIGIVGIGLILITVGAFGPKVTSVLAQPLFLALKSSNVLGVFEGIESLFVSVWIIADFAMLIFHTIIASVILKKLFKLQSRATMIAPILFIAYMLSIVIANNFFVIMDFSNYIISPLNIVMGVIIPMLSFIIIKTKNRNKESSLKM